MSPASTISFPRCSCVPLAIPAALPLDHVPMPACLEQAVPQVLAQCQHESVQHPCHPRRYINTHKSHTSYLNCCCLTGDLDRPPRTNGANKSNSLCRKPSAPIHLLGCVPANKMYPNPHMHPRMHMGLHVHMHAHTRPRLPMHVHARPHAPHAPDRQQCLTKLLLTYL